MKPIEPKKIQIPLLKDHHNHLSFYALLHDRLNLQGIKDKQEALEQMRSFTREGISVVIGWNSGYYHFTTGELESLPPVIIVNVSLHSILMNSSAEARLAGNYPEIVANYKDPQWYEDHMPQMLIFLANQVEPTREKFERFFNFLYEKGVYYAEEMHLANERVFSVLRSTSLGQRTAFWTDLSTFKTLSPGAQQELKGIKLFTDGAVGARTAALEQPYRDGRKGYLLYSDEVLYRAMEEVSVIGKVAAVHAIGEMASAQVVRTVRQLKKKGVRLPGVRMEHCQFIDKKTASDAKELGIILSMQPNFSTDSVIYRDRLLPQYIEKNNPFRMLIDEVGYEPGEDLIFGSDGMPHGADAALEASLHPPYPGQKLTLEEITAGYGMLDKSHGYIELEMDEVSIKSLVVRRAGI